MGTLNEFRIANIIERIKKIEDVLFKKTKREETTRAQQMLLIKHTGILEHIAGLGMNKNKM